MDNDLCHNNNISKYPYLKKKNNYELIKSNFNDNDK